MNYYDVKTFFDYMEHAKAVELSINYGDTTAFFYIDKNFKYTFWNENTLFIKSQGTNQIINIKSISSIMYEVEEEDE